MNPTEIIISNSAQETREIASRLAQRIEPGAVVGIFGPLAAGKTEFVRGFSEYFGCHQLVKSPSYVLENIYPVPTPNRGVEFLHHWDLYRLTGDCSQLELQDLHGRANCLTLIEWPEKVDGLESIISIEVRIDILGDENRRLSLSTVDD